MNEKANLLVVDYNPLNRKILCKILNTAGYYTVEAENGKAALDILERAETSVSLILLDITMPVMNGYELLQKLNENGMITSIPVIMTTGSDGDGTEIRCLENGASDFLTKPYNPDLVRHRVQSLLRLCENVALISKLEYDRLTHVYSKEFFYHHVESQLADHPEKEYVLYCCDIVNFKVVNEKFGTDVGDDLLRFVATTCQQFAGEQNGFCGRIGADTFAVLREKSEFLSQNSFGQWVAERMKDAPVKNIDLKFGIYVVADRTLPISGMYDRAALALDAIKHKYGVIYGVYDDSLRDRMLREHMLSDVMEQGLAEKQFQVYLQPKHDVNTGEIAGAEALARWIHPEMGFISPGEFIPMFERNGFIAKLDHYMWEAVCEVQRRWMQEGRKMFPISVNASRVDFADSNLPKEICELTDHYGIPHELFHLEVTESAYTDKPQQMISAVSELRALGFKIEMDDFGSGYSSLNMLSELPIDILKLDMRFLQKGVVEDSKMPGNKQSILSFIISLSKWLQLPTVAEGVENVEEVQLLKSMGCNLIQGFYFARPMPVKDFEAYMDQCGQAAPEQPAVQDLPEVGQAVRRRKECTVLVVEDIESNRAVLCTLLEPYYDVATAENGEEAYAYIQENHDKIGVILLDLLMPVMDGFRLLELMKNAGYLDEISVIITSEAGAGSALRALRLGAYSFLAKPYDLELLLNHVDKALNEHEFRREKRRLEMECKLLQNKNRRDGTAGLMSREEMIEAVKCLPAAEKMTVLMLDVDHLKEFNDACGKAAGDKTLREIGQLLMDSTRAGDLIARFGGDGFLLVLRQMGDTNVAVQKCTRLCAALRKKLAEESDKLTCSVGATVAQACEDFDAMCNRAEQALHDAKQKGSGVSVASVESAQ